MSAVTAGSLPEAPEDWGRGAVLPVIQGLEPEAPFWSVARMPVRLHSPPAALLQSVEPDPETPPQDDHETQPRGSRKRKSDGEAEAREGRGRGPMPAASNSASPASPLAQLEIPALLLARWAANLSTLTRGRCSPNLATQEAALVLFARFTTSTPAADATEEGPLDAEALQSHMLLPVRSGQQGHLLACLWLAMKLVEHQTGIMGARVMCVTAGMVPVAALLPLMAAPPQCTSAREQAAWLFGKRQGPGGGSENTVLERASAAVARLRACEAEVGNALHWNLAQGLSLVSPAGRTPSDDGNNCFLPAL